MTTWSTAGSSWKRNVAVARASSASNSTIGQTTRPNAVDGLFGERELFEEVWVDACARLVTREQVIAKRFNDVIEGAGDVGRPGPGDEGEEAFEQAQRSANLTTIGSFLPGRAVETAEELVGSVDKMDFHLPPRCGRLPG